LVRGGGETKNNSARDPWRHNIKKRGKGGVKKKGGGKEP